VLTDLRGYGDSSKPPGGENHADYTFRAMAQDQVEVMSQLGHTRFSVAGHDRGGRVAHRMCLDYPMWLRKWRFSISPLPLRCTAIRIRNSLPSISGGFPVYYLRDHLLVQGKTPGAVTPEAMAEYIRCYCSKASIHAVCEDYQAAASVDLEMDRVDDAAGRRIQAQVLAVWGAEGTVGHLWDVLATWRAQASGSVTGKALPCGHLIPEESPQELLSEFRSFFTVCRVGSRSQPGGSP
jgi:haloacetate dehalogenase